MQTLTVVNILYRTHTPAGPVAGAGQSCEFGASVFNEVFFEKREGPSAVETVADAVAGSSELHSCRSYGRIREIVPRTLCHATADYVCAVPA